MPRRATRARRIPFSVGPFSVGGCRMVPTPGQRYRGRRDGLDIEAGGGVVVAPFSFGPFSVGPCRMVPTPGQLRGQPDNTPPIETAPTIGHWGVLSLWHLQLA